MEKIFFFLLLSDFEVALEQGCSVLRSYDYLTVVYIPTVSCALPGDNARGKFANMMCM